MKNLKLHEDWKLILRKAWSIRLGLIAAIFSGAEVVLPMFSGSVPRNLFAVLSFVAVAGAVIARLVAQKEMSDDA